MANGYAHTSNTREGKGQHEAHNRHAGHAKALRAIRNRRRRRQGKQYMKGRWLQ